MEKDRRPRMLVSSFDLEKQLRRLSESTLGAQRGQWPFRGMELGFPLLSERISGQGTTVTVLASAVRMGKSSFSLQLAFDMLIKNPDLSVIFVSLDQPVRDLNVRLISLAGRCPSSYVLDPRPENSDKYDEARQRGLSMVLGLRDRLTLVDESLGHLRMSDIESFVRQKKGRSRRPLVLFVDPYYKIRSERLDVLPEVHAESLLSDFKTLASSQEVGIVLTTRLARGAGLRRPDLADLEDQPSVLYDSHVLALLYCDFFNDGETPFLDWEWGTDDTMVPIFELNLAKNKMGTFAGRLYYRFYTSQSRFKECSQLEVDNYDQMLKNLRVHDRQDPEVDESIEPMHNIETDKA